MDWEELYLQYSDAVHNYIFLIVGNEETAEDLTHETFVKVKHSLERFNGEASYKTWLFSIARNSTYDFLRRKKLVQFVPFMSTDIEDKQLTPEDYLNNKESTQALYIAIKKLKLAYQEVIILRYIHELSIEETAAVLNWSISKVKSKTFIAMKKLKAEMNSKEEQNGLLQ
jgi:RNA polymerase sigma-70 factor, ECF subfamily